MMDSHPSMCMCIVSLCQKPACETSNIDCYKSVYDLQKGFWSAQAHFEFRYMALHCGETQRIYFNLNNHVR